ncbi:MAG: hypothetical protein R3E96_00510 [Planctomycetota bacterium]
MQREQQALREQLDRAEFARLEGLQAVDRGEWALAIEKFESALESAPAGWQHSAVLRKDIEALKGMERSQ